MTTKDELAKATVSANKHIFEFLDDYILSPTSLRSAVLINGAWGIGKSYSIGKYIEKLREQKKLVVYVSLYGVTSTDEIDTMLLAGAYALTDNVVARHGLRIAKAALKKVSLGAEAKISDFLPKSKVDLFVFDDLERALLPPGASLGYVNGLVEHDGARVLIVCNEKEIADSGAYDRIREKVVGTSFDYQLEEHEPLAAFIREIPDSDARKFLETHSETALLIFQQSDEKSTSSASGRLGVGALPRSY